jgi:hypothetical protein
MRPPSQPSLDCSLSKSAAPIKPSQPATVTAMRTQCLLGASTRSTQHTSHDTNKYHTVLGCDDKRCTPALQQAHGSQAAYCQLLAHSHPSFRTTTAAASLQRCAQTRPPKHLQVLLAPRWWPVLAPHCRSALPGLLGQLLGWRGPGRDLGSPCPAAGRRGASARDTQHGSEGEGWALCHIVVAEPPVLCRS